ncbi:MAG: hypothetical protein HY287_03470 [Planctomycetes bacterium]|nr:hypothetical protein [Planctomycetota bacterium]MBI3833370.1 hypothetical protein [Planctomycetota bacterium]
MPERSPTISFRLPASFVAQLDEQTEKYNAAHGRDKLSRNDFARKALIDALGGAEKHEQLRDDVVTLRAEVTKIRADLATATAGILAVINEAVPKEKRSSPEQIKSWIKANLLA